MNCIDRLSFTCLTTCLAHARTRVLQRVTRRISSRAASDRASTPNATATTRPTVWTARTKYAAVVSTNVLSVVVSARVLSLIDGTLLVYEVMTRKHVYLIISDGALRMRG